MEIGWVTMQIRFQNTTYHVVGQEMGRRYELLSAERAAVKMHLLNEMFRLAVDDTDDDDSDSEDADDQMSFLKLLAQLYCRRNHTLRPSGPRRYVRIDNFNDSQCLQLFRFRQNDLRRLFVSFRMPNVWVIRRNTHHRQYFPGETGFLLLMRRFSYPCRYSDLVNFFHLSVADLSHLFNVVLHFVYDNHASLLTNLDMWMQDFDWFGNCVRTKANLTLPNVCVWGFIDGTVRAICRPTWGQRSMYNGHKRVHALKYESVMLPNGIIGWIYGPIEGRRHDSFMSSISMLGDSFLYRFISIIKIPKFYILFRIST